MRAAECMPGGFSRSVPRRSARRQRAFAAKLRPWC